MTILQAIKGRVKDGIFSVMELVGPLFNRSQGRDLTAVKKILVVQGGGIGDLIRAMPAFQSLRLNFPQASVTLMTSPAARQILPHYPVGGNFDEVIEFDFKRCQRSLTQKIALIRDLRRKKFDLVYWPSRGEGMREEGAISLLTGARHRLGFRAGRTGTHNTISLEFNDFQSISSQNLAIIKAAGLSTCPLAEQFMLTEGDKQKAREILSSRFDGDDSSRLVVVHPGATWNARYRVWPADRYRALIESLVQDLGARVVIVGSREERTEQEDVFGGIGERVINVAGETSVAEMAAMIGISQLFIGNDSGPLHIAMALGTPAIGIFGATAEQQVISNPNRCTVIKRDLPCRPCYSHQHQFRPSCASPLCLEEIPVADVFTVAKSLLRRGEDCVSA